MKTISILMIALTLTGCGIRAPLSPQKGVSLPQKPAMASKVPTAVELVTPDTQSRPERSDEQLRRSEERQDDKFDLPPAG